MSSPASEMFEQLSDFSAVEELILNGEAEGLHLECKAPSGPHLNPGLKAQLGQAISGFSNTGGGVILWGVSTVRHAASGLDILTQVEPVGQVRRFAQQVDRSSRVLAYPAVDTPPSRVLHQAARDSKGVAVTYIPPTESDPVLSLVDKKFYFRHGDEFLDMPYEMLRRMFAGASAPVLEPIFDPRLITVEQGVWQIPIVLINKSSAASDKTRVTVEVLNPDACESIECPSFADVSHINPGQTMFSQSLDEPIFRQLNYVAGTLSVKMKRGKRPRRILRLRMRIYSSRMRAREWTLTIQLAQKGFSIREAVVEDIY